MTILCLLGGALLLQEDREIERLRSALQEARRELERERTRIAREEEEQRKELQRLERERDSLTDRMVDLEVSIGEGRKQVRALRRRRDEMSAELGVLEKELEEADRIFAEARSRLGDLLDVLPPSEKRPQQRERLASGSPRDLVEVMASILEEGQGAAVFESEVVRPDGRLEKARLLRVGQIFWAYAGKDSGGIAVAVKAPEGGEGFRWRSGLAPELERMVREGIEDVAAGGASIVSLPVDVTTQMAAVTRSRITGLVDDLLAGGPVMIPIGIVGLLAVILILERLIFLARQGRGSVRTGEEVLALVREGRLGEARQYAASRPGPVARILCACLDQRGKGEKAIQDAVQEGLLHEAPRMERFLPAIGLLAAVAPLLGLLGTVTGMILTFEMITVFGTGEPRIMAGGISQALITTASGLAVAVPVLLAHSYVSSRVDRLMADAERYAASLLSLLRGQE